MAPPPDTIYEHFFKLDSLYSDSHSGLAPASDRLREYITHTTQHPDPTETSSCWGILEFCKRFPQAIDFALQVYTKASSVDGNAVTTDTTFAEEYKAPLRDLIGNHAKYFQGNSGPRIGREISWETYDKATGDACNLVFQKTEVDESPEQVVMRIKNFQDTRLEIIILQAIRGRSHAMDLVSTQQDSLDWIHFHLDPFHEPSPPWSKVDFIAICVLLRACAKSLLEGLSTANEKQATLANWKGKFSVFIYSDKPATQNFPFNRDGDFVIKAHAALVLDNLMRGPFNENSRDIFKPAIWVF